MSSSITESLAAAIVAGHGRTTAQIARRLPPTRMRRPTTTAANPATVYRWITRGVTLSDGRVVRLAAIRVAGQYLTTDEAVAEFLRAQQLPSDPSATAPARPARQRRAADADAARQLERLGI